MKKKFWHRLSFENQKKVFEEKITIQEFLDRFRFPTWCTYHLEEEKDLICMSLTKPDRKVISKKSNCSRCEFCKK